MSLTSDKTATNKEVSGSNLALLLPNCILFYQSPFFYDSVSSPLIKRCCNHMVCKFLCKFLYIFKILWFSQSLEIAYAKYRDVFEELNIKTDFRPRLKENKGNVPSTFSTLPSIAIWMAHLLFSGPFGPTQTFE